MSEYFNEVVRIGKVEKLSNADTLEITNILNGFPCIFKSGEFREGDLAAYISVDSLLPLSNPLFKFLDDGKGKEYYRLRARKLRGTFSIGLLVAAPEGFLEGQDVTEHFGIKKYIPPAEREYSPNHDPLKKDRKSETAQFDKRALALCLALGLLVGVNWFPLGFVLLPLFILGAYGIIKYNRYLNKRPNYPMYDLDSLRKYSDVFEEGEIVWVSEKVHGCNASFCNTGRRFFVKSRTVFRQDTANSPSIGEYTPKKDVFWKIAKKYDLKNKLKNHPGIVLYGEIYGQVQDLNYGVGPEEEVRFVAFDAMYLETRKYMDVGDFMEFCRKLEIPYVPTLFHGPFNQEQVVALAEGPSMMPGAKHCREGVVVKPLHERRDNRIGRVVLKLAGQNFLLRKDD